MDLKLDLPGGVQVAVRVQRSRRVSVTLQQACGVATVAFVATEAGRCHPADIGRDGYWFGECCIDMPEALAARIHTHIHGDQEDAETTE